MATEKRVMLGRRQLDVAKIEVNTDSSDYDRNYRRERNTGYSECDRRENRYREQRQERGRYELRRQKQRQK